MSILKAAATSKVARVGVAAGLAAGALVATASTSYAAVATATVAPATGPAASTTAVLSITGSGFKNAAGVNQVAAIHFNQLTACPTTQSATSASVIAASTLTVVSATKLVVTTPSLPDTNTAGVHTKRDYVVCLYKTGGTGAAIVAGGKYTVYPQPAITSVLPASGANLGGDTITVVGTGFTAKTAVTVGGVAATNVKVAADGASLTATTPAHAPAAAAVDVVATTEGGASTGGTGAFTYKYAIKVSPQIGANGAGNVITVTGTGFSAMTFNSGAHKAQVYLVNGKYSPVDNSGSKTNAEQGTCGSVQVVSDTELVCTMPSKTDAAFTVTVVNDDAIDAGTAYASYLQSEVSAASTFTFSAF
ncbi:MAG: IPT/TIG domain-containing protein [Kineosporiaceae bacterium]